MSLLLKNSGCATLHCASTWPTTASCWKRLADRPVSLRRWRSTCIPSGMPCSPLPAREALLPLDGVLVRHWDPDNRPAHTGIRFGARLYEIEGITLVAVRAYFDENLHHKGLHFVAVDRSDYGRLYRIARHCAATRNRRRRRPFSIRGSSISCGKTRLATWSRRT